MWLFSPCKAVSNEQNFIWYHRFSLKLAYGIWPCHLFLSWHTPSAVRVSARKRNNMNKWASFGKHRVSDPILCLTWFCLLNMIYRVSFVEISDKYMTKETIFGSTNNFSGLALHGMPSWSVTYCSYFTLMHLFRSCLFWLDSLHACYGWVYVCASVCACMHQALRWSLFYLW